MTPIARMNRRCLNQDYSFHPMSAFLSAGIVRRYWTLCLLLISANIAHSQNVIAWGNGSQGQTNIPPLATNVVAVAAGALHSLGLCSGGTVICWGSGAGTNIPPGVTNAVAIAAGMSHGLALLADHSVVAWGDNSFGQTNIPASATNVIAVAAGYYHCLGLRADGTVVAWGKSDNGQTNAPSSATNIVAITAGAEHSMGLRDDGSVVIWGGITIRSNVLSYAQTPMPRTVRDVVAISAGAYQNLALAGSGQVVTWGYNDKKPGVPATATNVVLAAAGTNYDLALRADGRIISWGSGTITNVPSSATNVVAIAAGLSHCLAVRGDGIAPQVLGRIAYRAQCAAGSPLPLSVRAIGSNPLDYQWLADGTPLPDGNTPFPQIAATLGGDSVSYHVVTSNSFGSVTSGVVRVIVNPVNGWGDDLINQTKPPSVVTNPVILAAGAFHGLALDSSGGVVAWGKNWDGQTNVPPMATNVVAVAAGTAHSLALKDDGSVVAWGRDWDGQTDVPGSATNIVAISAGWAHSLVLRADGTVVAWGNDDYGQTDFPFLGVNVIAISAGYYHNMALRADGIVVTWAFDYPTPLSASNAVAVAAGWKHCLALRADGSVVAWGDNSYGQCAVPASATNVISIAAGYYHNLALRADGRVVAWGKSYLGVTDVPAGLTNAAAIFAGEDYSMALVASGPPRFSHQTTSVVGGLGGLALLTANVTGTYPLAFQWYHNGVVLAGATNRYLVVSNAQPADEGGYVLVATNAAGEAASQPVNLVVRQGQGPAASAIGAWGDNADGQCNVSHEAATPCAIAAGAYHSLALNADGSVVAWGKNWDGQTNAPPSATNVVAIAAGAAHSLALRYDGSVIAWGRNWDGQTNVPSTATNVVAIAAGQAHSVALRADGTVVAWGNNDFGQTSVSFLATKAIAIAAGYYHTLALLSDHTVASWGSQDTVPSSATNVLAIAGGFEHSVALKADGTVVAWGDNTFGQTNVPASATNIVAIATAWYHTLALKTDGTVVAWGMGYYGVTNVPAGLTDVVSIATGEDYSAVVVSVGQAGFGHQLRSAVAHLGSPAILNTYLQGSYASVCQWFRDGIAILGATNCNSVLNNATIADAGSYTLVVSNRFGVATNQPILLTVSPTPSMTALVGAWGDDVNGTCDIPAAIVDPRAIAAGSGHCLALQGDGSVVAWGDNSYGQTNVPSDATNVVAIAAGDYHSLAVRADGVLLAWGRNDCGQTDVPFAATNIVSIAAGMGHSVIVRSDGVIVAWGRNYEHETDVPGLLPAAVAVASGPYHTLALLSDQTVVSWSVLDSVPPSATNVVAIAGGFEHSLALKADGTVLAWGDNTFGQTNVPASATNIVAIAAGYDHSLALRADGILIAWGLGYFGSTNTPAGLGNVASIAARGDYSAALVRLAPPQLSVQPGSVITHAGRGVVLGANTQGPYPLALQWLHDGNTVIGATNWFLWLPACRWADAGEYVLVGTNAFGPAASQPVNLVVQPEPFFATTATAQTVLIGGSASLSPIVYGEQPMSYQWQLNGLNVAGATNTTLSLPFANWTNAGVYHLVVSNLVGSVTGPPIELTVFRALLQFDTSPGGILVSNDGTHLRVLGAAGIGPLVILTSSDLQTWEPILTNPPVIGAVEFIDPEVGDQAAKFYRAMEGVVAGPLRIDIATTLSKASDGALPLRLTGMAANGPVIIYASSNLLDWSAIFTNPPTIGPLQYLEAPPTGQPGRFYRASEYR